MSLYALLLLLVARESAAVEVTLPRGVAAIAAIIDVVGADDHATARTLLVWAWHESRLDPCAVGDHGKALGLLQTHGTPEARCDARASVRAAVRLLRVLDVACGSRLGALRAYASGRCDGAGKLVASRCRTAGGC